MLVTIKIAPMVSQQYFHSMIKPISPLSLKIQI